LTAIKVEMFGGMAPAVNDRYLPVNNASYAVNSWLDLGTLTGFYQLQEIATMPIPQVGKVYRIPLDYDASYITADSVYMYFENPDTDIIRGAVFGDTYDRYYWASSSTPPKYATHDMIIAGLGAGNAWLLGIPTPSHAPTLVVTGGTGTTTFSRAYVVTYVSEYGEEGAPSPPVNGTGLLGATWTLSNLPVPDPDDMGVNRNILTKRIYRTITGSTGVATFFMVVELPATDTDFIDNIADEDITGNKQLESTLWTPPPADLEGFCMGPNGIIGSWRDNELWFSEPYRPHAWPATYVLTVEYPVVGMASIGNMFFVMTRGYPVVVSGSVPSQLQPVRVTMFEPCTSRGGIVTFPEGVYYPSGNGLILLSPGGSANATKTFITKERWQTYVQGARFRAGRLGSVYYGYGTVQFGVFQQDAFDNDAFAMEDYSGAMNGIYIDATNQRISLILLRSDTPINNVQNDAWSSELVVLKGNKVYWQNLSDVNQPITPAQWTSKEFQMPYKQSLGAAMIFFDIPFSTPLQNPVRDTDQNQILKSDQYGIVRWYGDNRLLAVHEIRKDAELLRLPSETKYDVFRFEVETRVDISAVHVASAPKELRGLT
jgi:hypothetical protein